MRRPGEFRYVCPRYEGAPIANEHDGRGIALLCLFHAIEETLPDMVAERVDRWIIDANDRDVAVKFKLDGLRELCHMHNVGDRADQSPIEWGIDGKSDLIFSALR